MSDQEIPDDQRPTLLLQAIGTTAGLEMRTPIQPGKQKDRAYVWKAVSVHPLQSLENTYQRLVRRDPNAEFDQLGKFFQFDELKPKSFSEGAARPVVKNPLAAVKMNYTIAPFYLFRLLVQYVIESDSEVSADERSSASKALTSLLHDKVHTPWLSAWLIEKIGELGDAVEELDDEYGGDRVRFFLKGGRALNYFLGTPQNGENDWDTQILINPNIPSVEWYELFAKVNDLMLAKLTEFKDEFADLLGLNGQESLEYARHLVNRSSTLSLLYADDEYEDDVYEDESSRSEREEPGELAGYDGDSDESASLFLANCKAELIDIGIPRRDTPEALEEWAHLKGDLITSNRVRFPGHQYYLTEHLTMARERFLDNADNQKTPTRIQRLRKVLQLDSTDQTLALQRARVHKVLPKIADAVDQRGPISRRLLTLMMDQFIDAYDLEDDLNLVKYFDSKFSVELPRIGDTLVIAKELATAIDKAKNWTVEDQSVFRDVVTAQAISKRMKSHYIEVAASMKRIRKYCRGFISLICSGFTKSAYEDVDENEDLSVEIAITGSYAAYLHAKYLQFDRDRLSALEPIRRIDITLFTLGEKADVLKYVRPNIESLLDKQEWPLPFDLIRVDENAMWIHLSDRNGFDYKPLAFKISVKHVTRLPQLAYIKTMPVLDLRYLALEYRQKASEIDELGYRLELKSTTFAVSEILSKFEF